MSEYIYVDADEYWPTVSNNTERLVVRLEAALEDFKAKRMTVRQFRAYLRRVEAM